MPSTHQLQLEQEQKRQRFYSILRILLVALVLVAVIAPTGLWLQRKLEANLVLTQAKAVNLAANTVVLECYAKNKLFADQTAAFGTTASAQKAIRELAKCEGDYYLLQWDANNFKVRKFAYVEDGHLVVCTIEGENQRWENYRLQAMVQE